MHTIIVLICLLSLFARPSYVYNVEGDAGHVTGHSGPGEGEKPRTPPSEDADDGKGNGDTSNDKGDDEKDNGGTEGKDPDEGDPVDMVDGNFHHTVADFFVPTVGLPLNINRTYHNRTQYQKGYFGFGWTSLFDMSVVETQAGDGTKYAEFRREDGTSLMFKLKPDGTYESPKGWNLALKRVMTYGENNSRHIYYTLRKPDGTEYIFYYYYPKISQDFGILIGDGGEGASAEIIRNSIHIIRNCQWQNREGAGYNGLQSVRDRYGNGLYFSYIHDYLDSTYFDNRVKRVTITHYPSSKKVTLSLDKVFSDKEISLFDGAGFECKYKFDDDSNLVKVTSPLSGEISYTYNSKHNLLTIKNEKGAVNIDNSYDSTYDRVSTQFYNGGTYKFNYGASNSNEIIDRRGNKTVYYYDAVGNITRVEEPLAVITVQTYDTSNNKLKSVTQGDHKTTYEYDSSGDVVQIDKYVTTNVSYRIKYEYETTYNQVTKIVRSKYNWLAKTDDFINATVYEYEGPRGALSKIIRGYGTDLADTTFLEYFDREGIWRYGLPVRISKIVNGTLRNSVECEYDSSGWVTAVKSGEYKKRIIRRAYDNRGNVINQKVCLANTDGSNEETKSESILTYSELNQLKEVKDFATGKTTKFDYDLCNNLTMITNAGGLITENIYNNYNQLKATVRKRGQEKIYDSVGYGYDSSENLTGITDASGRTTKYEYDGLDRVKKIIDPLTYTTQFNYDQWRNLTSRITPNNQTITYEYDWLNRMTKKKYVGTSPLEEFTYTYKDDTFLLSSAVSSINGGINYTYDDLNRLIQMVDQYYNTTNYEYDELGRKKAMGVSSTNQRCEYYYDDMNQLMSMVAYDTLYYFSSGFQYDAFGRMSKKQMSNGTYTEYQSDHLGRLSSLLNYRGNNSVISQYLSDYSGAFDLLGNRKKVYTMEGMNEYSYDSIYQLTKAVHPANQVEEYQYDSVGNRVEARLSVPVQGDYVYDSNNRLQSITPSAENLSPITYTYDNGGNRVTKLENSSTTSYAYDYENRLRRIDFADGGYAEYVYDGLGRRIEKKIWTTHDSSLTTLRYSYDGEDIVAVLDSTNTAIASIVHGPGIDHPLCYKDIVTGKVYYYHADYLGSITSITDSNQTVVETYKYYAFGNLLTTNDYSLTTVLYAYTGREYDSESGLYFYRARYYDSKVGRFLEPDPIGFLGGMNFYAYVGNNPVNLVDPWGWCEEEKEEWEEYGSEEAYEEMLAGGNCEPVPSWENPIDWAVAFGVGFRGKIDYHPGHAGGPHQYPHIQITTWLKNISKSHINIRIPW